jgi:hypothetical protein
MRVFLSSPLVVVVVVVVCCGMLLRRWSSFLWIYVYSLYICIYIYIYDTAYRDLVVRRNATSDTNTASRSNTITISASSQTSLSFLKVYYDATKDRVYPFLTAIIDVQKGVVRGITWDDACVFCGGTECLENTYNYNGVAQNKSSAGQVTRSCFVTTEDCNNVLSTNASAITCDITMYVVWSGTDANGIALQSQAYRFSAFPPQELKDRLTQLLVPDKAADLINDRNTTTSGRQLPVVVATNMMEQHYEQQQQQPYTATTVVTVDSMTTTGASSMLHEDGRDL